MCQRRLLNLVSVDQVGGEVGKDTPLALIIQYEENGHLALI